MPEDGVGSSRLVTGGSPCFVGAEIAEQRLKLGARQPCRQPREVLLRALYPQVVPVGLGSFECVILTLARLRRLENYDLFST